MGTSHNSFHLAWCRVSGFYKPQLQDFPWGGKQLDHTSNAPTFPEAPQRIVFYLVLETWHILATWGSVRTKMTVLFSTQLVTTAHPTSSVQSKELNTHTPQLQSCLFHSAEGAWHIMDTMSPLQTTKADWTNIRVWEASRISGQADRWGSSHVWDQSIKTEWSTCFVSM